MKDWSLYGQVNQIIKGSVKAALFYFKFVNL